MTDNASCMRRALVVVLLAQLACTSSRVTVPAVSTAANPVTATLAEADRQASRGCYLCLQAAAGGYAEALSSMDDPALLKRALENALMILLREAELRIPDSGAREEARSLQARVPESYALYFRTIDALERDQVAMRGEWRSLAMELEKQWPASPMKAYFYVTAALSGGGAADLKAQVSAILDTHSTDLGLVYRMLAFPPTFSADAARQLVADEAGFGEVPFVVGRQAVLDARLDDAHRELTRARQILPDSSAINLLLGNVKLAYARYAEALVLFEQVLRNGPDEAAGIGRAKALSYLGRHGEALVALSVLLENVQNNPGEKYYWRAWNNLRLSRTQEAHEDALSALKAMRNNDVFRLAGIASFGLGRLLEARGQLESALEMKADDCDAQRVLAQLDATERRRAAASARFASAVACYDRELTRMRHELARHEQDISGLSNGLIASLRHDIKVAEGLRATSARNADLLASTTPNAESLR